MLLSFNWLKDYLQKPDIKLDIKKLAEQATMRGLQVSQIRHSSLGLDSVVVGKIKEISPHPNADRLQITQVVTSDDGDGERLQIVCGAKNIAVDDIVPVALPGASLPGGLDIKVSKIRGVESFGMLCSAKELSVSDDSEGILQLPKHSTLGEPISRLLGGGQDDTILEFELTANRPDCLSIIGLARELSPLLKTKVRMPKATRFRVTPHRTSAIVKVEVEDTSLCSRYVARVIDNLKVEPSPKWIQDRLESIGLHAINNIVDVTNFVMYEYGQPLHAFDLRKIQSGTLRIAACSSDTPMTLLSGQTVALAPGDIVIWDGERPIALAGIMGGADSQVQQDTTSILLESAAFDADQIRLTAKRLGLSTEASKRFEKGCDRTITAVASDRAAALLRDTVSANVYHPPIDTDERPPEENYLVIDLRDVKRITGLSEITNDKVAELLEIVGISSHKRSSNILSVQIPHFRLDLNDSIDIIEEVARLHGYETIPTRLPISTAAYDRFDEQQIDFERHTKAILAELGLCESINYSFTSEELLRKFGLVDSATVELSNPLSEQMQVLRTSLIPSLVQTYLHNKNRKAESQRLFELARTYRKDAREQRTVKETTWAAGLLSGKVPGPNWRQAGSCVDFYTVKGIVEALLGQLITITPSYEQSVDSRVFHPMRSAVIRLGHRPIGQLGELHPMIHRSYLGGSEPVVVFEVNLDVVRRFTRTNSRYRAPSKFPPVEIDFAFTVDVTTTHGLVAESIRQAAGDLLIELDLFDMYEGKNIAEGKKSLAYRLTLNSNDHTLKEEEISTLRTKIIETVASKAGGLLRA